MIFIASSSLMCEDTEHLVRIFGTISVDFRSSGADFKNNPFFVLYSLSLYSYTHILEYSHTFILAHLPTRISEYLHICLSVHLRTCVVLYLGSDIFYYLYSHVS